MKKLKIAVCALFVTAAVSAQDISQNEVPMNIKNSFQKNYAAATDTEWEMDGANYRIEFDLGEVENEIWYSKDGAILKTKLEITATDLPAAVANTIKNNYPKYKIDEVEVTNENGAKIYEVELEKMFNKDIELVLDDKGTIIKESK